MMPRLVESAAAMCKVHPQLHFIVNFYDSDPTPFAADALVRQHSRNSSCVEGTHVAGMKTVFWKRVITPELMQGALWASFMENIIEDSYSAIGFMDQIFGLEPVWQSPTLIESRPAFKKAMARHVNFQDVVGNTRD